MLLYVTIVWFDQVFQIVSILTHVYTYKHASCNAPTRPPYEASATTSQWPIKIINNNYYTIGQQNVCFNWNPTLQLSADPVILSGFSGALAN